jgi:hypothetical protein
MNFEFVQTFDTDPDTLARVMFSPEMAEFLSKNIPSVEGVEALSREESEQSIKRRVKYRPVPVIKKVATKEVRPEWMHFVEETTYDKRSRTATFRNVPTTGRVAELMENRGTITFEAAGPGKTKRTMRGELKIKVFMLGAIAERLIYPHAQKILDEEARALAKFLQSQK